MTRPVDYKQYFTERGSSMAASTKRKNNSVVCDSVFVDDFYTSFFSCEMFDYNCCYCI